MKIKSYVNPNALEDVVRINYIYSFRKDELPKIQLILKLLLEGTITQKNKTSLKRKLMKNYDANIDITGIVISNVSTITFEISGIDSKMLPGNEKIIKNLTNILLDCINNANILVRNIDANKLKEAKKNILSNREANKNSIYNVIEEVKDLNENYEKVLKETTLDDLRDLYIKILTTGKRYIQVQAASEEECNVIQDIIINNLCFSKEEDIEFKFKNLEKLKMVTRESHLDSTRLDFVLQRNTQKMNAKELALMMLIATIYNDLMFNIVREKYNLSYNPGAVANITENSIILSANIAKENKNFTINLINSIVKAVKELDIDPKSLEKYISILDEAMEEDLDSDVYNETLNIDYLTKEEIENINYKDLKEHAKNYDIKLVYYLGGK